MAPSPGFLLWGLWWLGTNDAATWEGECSDSIGLIPDSLGRRDRRRLTKLLNAQVSCLVTPLPVWDPLLGLRGGAVVIRWRRRRGHMCERQRTTWQRQPQLSFWMEWPLRGRRVGEASHPGPEPGTPIGSERPPRERSPPPRAPAHGGAGAARGGRTYCPVAGCPCSDPARARGWANESSMRAHIDAHLAGSLDGDVPTAWMQARGRIRCPVCGLSVSERYGVHPTCRPEARAAAVDDVDAMEVDGLPLPTLAAIQSARTSTLRHIPMAARHAWNQVLTRALAAVAHRNDVATWLELLMLPQCVLCAPGRGGRRHRKAAAAFTLDRLQRWQEGERLSLWESRPRRRPPRSGPLTPEERRDIATSWGREGFDRKACAALMSKGLCPQTEETARALAALHPHRPLPSTPAMGDLPVPPALAPELVARCLRAFPVETAPGPTGLRVQHLRDACVAGGGDSFMAQLADVVNLMAQGRAPATIAPVLAGAGLVALPKPAGGVRPIAVGELLRRLTGKCLMAVVKDEARAFFWPAQVGVAVKGGAEKAVHAVRAWSARHSGSSHKALLKLDFRNAFNCVSREEVLKQTVVHFPALARWAAWCYRQPSCLQFGDRALESSAGVQQGDPLGPLLFSLALQPLAAELRSDSLDLAVHFLDDGVLAGDFAPLGAALRLAQTRSRAIGLELNLDKCELVVFGAPNTQLLRPHFPANLLQRPDGSSRVLVNNFEFLGAAIGEDSYICAHTAARAAKAGELLDAVAELEDPQVGLRLLRACAGFARVVHSMRCNPPCAQAAALATFDGHVQRCFGDLTGLHLTAGQWRQAARGVGQAGLGLRASLVHAPAAYLASLGASLADCADIDRAFSAQAVHGSPAVAAALRALNRELPQDSACPCAKPWRPNSVRFRSVWTWPAGKRSWRKPPWWKGRCSARKLASGPGPSWQLRPPVGHGSNQQFSALSCAFVWGCPMLRRTAGAPFVMVCWTDIATTLRLVLLVESALCATTLSGMSSTPGWTGRASVPKRSARGCSCPSLRMTPTWLVGDQLTFTCLP